MPVTISGTTGITGPDGSASTPSVAGGDSNTGVFFPAADTVAIATGGTEALRVNSSRNVGIGTSSPSFTSGGGLMIQNGTQANLRLDRFGEGGFELQSVASTLRFYSTAASAERLRIDSSGNMLVPGIYNLTTGAGANVHVASDGTLYRSTSSLKYKTDVQDATHGIAEVMALRPVTYKGVNDGETVFGGLIAEEVHDAGLTEFVQYAEDGTPDALAYGNMVALAFKAIQELKGIVDSQAARIAALEGAK